MILHTGVSLSSGHYTAFVRPSTEAFVRNLAKRQQLQQPAADINSNSISEHDSAAVAVTLLPKMELGLGDHADVKPPAELTSIVAFPQPVWYECDDDMITAMLESDVEKKLAANGSTTPYMLFYRRIIL